MAPEKQPLAANLQKQGDLKKIIFTVTNDLNHDQRMIRICSSLATAGYQVELVGVEKPRSSPLMQRTYRQKRLGCFFTTGPGFYAEYNIRLFFYLLFRKADARCCIDLDTMLPVWLTSKIRGGIRVYDAHEYFSQQKEVISRPRVHAGWKWIEKNFVPSFRFGYTVSQSIAEEFKKLYGVDYELVRNMPALKELPPKPQPAEKRLLYQGAVNEARGFEYLIPAMKAIDAPLDIYGDGNFMEQTKKLIAENNLAGKVFVKGNVLPDQLDPITQQACIGLNLVENRGLNQYYSLANKFFDYIQHGVPQVTMNFPEYKRINDEFEVALLLNDLHEESISRAVNELLHNRQQYERLQQNCLIARQQLNWQHEEPKLLDFYKKLF